MRFWFQFCKRLPANAPDIIAIRLAIVVRVAVVEIHVPRVGSVARARGGCPIVVAGGYRFSAGSFREKYWISENLNQRIKIFCPAWASNRPLNASRKTAIAVLRFLKREKPQLKLQTLLFREPAASAETNTRKSGDLSKTKNPKNSQMPNLKIQNAQITNSKSLFNRNNFLYSIARERTGHNSYTSRQSWSWSRGRKTRTTRGKGRARGGCPIGAAGGSREISRIDRRRKSWIIDDAQEFIDVGQPPIAIFDSLVFRTIAIVGKNTIVA